MILRAQGLKKVYGIGEARVCALDGVSLEVERGEFVAVVGTSGSGKSTLLHMLGGLDVPTSGCVEVDGQELGKMDGDGLAIFRRRNIGFVFQQYNLVPVLNVYENIVFPVQSVWTGKSRSAPTQSPSSRHWVWRLSLSICPTPSRAGSSREWRSPAHCCPSRLYYWPMNPLGIWIPGPARMSWGF